ncbi:MAG: SMP-30/gluconolactonase/LRE family protein [Thiotrichaceae bacterium]|nr:SMP-30/gluconolactonase/LRE family protein [Thiotrichaceae bacterium]
MFLLLCLTQASQAASTYDISTIAGGGVGDGGLATSATFNNPTAVAIDSSGNTYIADSYNHRIRKIDNTGMISTIAGTGSGGYSGDGSAATTAKLYYSSGVAVDGSGNVYIADYFNHRIRKIEQSTGNISTIAGTGAAGYSGDGSAAISAKLNYPFSVAIDSGDNVYIADSANNRIRKIDQSTGNISTIAGTGTAGYSIDGFLATNADLNNPLDIAIDSVGNVYIADTSNNRIRKIDKTTGNISTIAGTGTTGYSGDGSAATSARLYYPSRVAVDSSGNVYIADPANNRIRKIDQSTSNISTIAGMGTSGYSGDGSAATSAKLNNPLGVAVDSGGNVYIVDTSNNRIRKIDKITSNISTIAGTGITTYSGDGSAAASATLYYPAGVSVDSSDNVYIADANNNRIRKIDKITGNISTIAGTGSTGYSGDGSAAINATLYYPNGAAADSAGNVYIADPYNYSLRKIDKSTGNISTIASGYSLGVAVDSFDNVYLADSAGNRIRKIDNTGNISTIAGTGTSGYSGNAGLATNATLNYPNGVAVDSNGNVYIADTSNHSIRKIDKTTGNISTIAGTGTSGYSGDGAAATSATLNSPNNVAVDSDGNVYIADTSNHRIRKIDKTTGNISTIAGTGTSGYSGDGSVAISATLYNPRGIAVDSSGNIYIGDTSNHCIRKLTPNLIAQTISFTPASTATYGDSTITLSATGGASGNPVTFASTTTSVCTVSGTSLTIVSAGTCTVTADQAGNASYSAAPQVSKNITVAKKSITAQADNKSRALGAANPTFTISYTGLINSDSSSAINTPPTASTTATTGSPTGNYVITCNNGSSSASNYIISTCTDGTLAVGKATPSISLTPASPSSSLGSALTVNFTVTGTPTPTGTVTVSDGTNSCTATVVAGTCSFTPATSGAKTLTATYAGDSNYTTATQTNTVNIAQVVLSSTSINVTEAGATGSYTVKLSTQPASDVTINLTPNAQVTISPATLTFTTTNWNTPQTVTVTAVDNSTYQGSRTVQIAHAITTGDGAGYPTNLSISSVNVNITDNEAPPYVPPSVSYYNLSVKTTGTGKGTVGGTNAGIYAQGTTVTLTATVDASSTFVAWTPASCASTFALNADTVCSAQFDLKPVVVTPPPIVITPVNYNLSLNTTGTGKGSIAGAAGSYVAGTSIQLTATAADASSTFVAWTPASCASAFTLNADTVCSAQFDLKPVVVTPPVVTPLNYSLSLNTTGTGKGSIAGAAGSYAQGKNVSLTATADANSTFVAWTPASCASAFALNADTVCSAQFDLKPVVMTTTPIISAAANPCIRNLSLNTSCSGAGEKTTIIEIGVSGELSNSIIDAPIISKGWLSNSLVTAKGRITGGFITGYLENLGIVSDIEFKGRYIKGGFLSGKIINSSTVGGYLENVTFTASASLTGGILQGNIKGNPNAPALLENVTIKQGSVLWGVTLGKGVILEAGVIVKENINLPILESPTAIDSTGKSILTSSLFYGGISVNGKPFVRSAVQLLAEPVVIRGRVIPEPEHVGKKADLFVYSPYWSSTTNLDSTPLSYYSADDKANILAWDQKIPTLVAFKKGMNLDSVHEVDMFVGNFIATGGLSIVFGYRLEDGTVIMNTVPNTIAVTIQ